MEAIQTISHNDFIIEVHYDQDPQDPREWDNLTTITCWHRRYNIGEKHTYADPEEFLKEADYCLILPLYLYDHSGITISTSPFSCRWDSGQVGYVTMTAETILKEYGSHEPCLVGKSIKQVQDYLTNPPNAIWRRLKTRLLDYMKAEVNEYDKYIRGEAYGYQISHPDDDSIDESCWGFSDINDCIAEAKAQAASLEKEKYPLLFSKEAA